MGIQKISHIYGDSMKINFVKTAVSWLKKKELRDNKIPE